MKHKIRHFVGTVEQPPIEVDTSILNDSTYQWAKTLVRWYDEIGHWNNDSENSSLFNLLKQEIKEYEARQ
ncbi:hypothetical protein H1O16_gp335 [Burkholderia phage BcepSaruman]|uniref:Uncharacterized protein n=1 Tax=Burkholderia phage BcepSaruman TaxID=2530032 RepID=A0A4D5ZI54_9CAUD|nr:hypothetical protein H1O16_gp335 [Burkholderia phage BcepSaruman]QBX06748.1 hypothetical protein BcepSaruman_335 [Burkholderia phage BcepSaruman]